MVVADAVVEQDGVGLDVDTVVELMIGVIDLGPLRKFKTRVVGGDDQPQSQPILQQRFKNIGEAVAVLY